MDNGIAPPRGGIASAIALALALSACGGGGSNVKDTPPPAPPPTTDPGQDDPYWGVGNDATFTVASGETFAKRIELGNESVLDNAGTIAGDLDIAVISRDSTVGADVLNHDGGRIEGNRYAILINGPSIISNTGAGSSIHSGGTAILVEEHRAEIENTGGATITSDETTIRIGTLTGSSTIVNGIGSTIATTGTATGDCATTGICSIYTYSDRPGYDGGRLELFNAGTIIGNVQLNPLSRNDVYLSAGSVIRGNLDAGELSTLHLDAEAGTTQLYSEAVTGSTRHGVGLGKTGDGTWIIDRDFVANGLESGPWGSVGVGSGVLQIGNGGTEGEIGWSSFEITNGDLVINRSDNVTIEGDIDGWHQASNQGWFVQAGTGTVTVTGRFRPPHARIEHGTLVLTNSQDFFVHNDSRLVFNGNGMQKGLVTGTGSVTKEGAGNLYLNGSTHTGGTTVNGGALVATEILTGNLTVNENGTFKGDGSYYSGAVTGVAGNLVSAGNVYAGEGSDTLVGGDYTQAATGTMSVSLGSKLDVAGTATLDGGTLYVAGRNMGYVANTHTEVLVADGGVFGTFDHLAKSEYAVFTSNTINYDANSVWLDTTGLDVTIAAAGDGVDYTPVSMASAQRVQGAFETLNARIAAGDAATTPDDFMRSAGQFQSAPTLQAAQASLHSLSGQLHAVGTAMTLRAIDASSQAVSDRIDDLVAAGGSHGMWTRDLGLDGGMGRTGFDGVAFRLNGWLVGRDQKVGDSGVVGFAFGQARGQQRLDNGFERDQGRSAEGMLYAGWVNGGWYSQGRLGFGQFEREIGRQLLLGDNLQGVQTRYNGSYGVAYGESGLRLGAARGHVTPFANLEYARTRRDGFVERGAGGFGLRSNAQAADRWQAGLGVRAGYSWRFSGNRGVDLAARALWRRTLTSHGNVFDASLVGIEQWQPLVGMGLSRQAALFDIGLDARLSANATLNFSYNYELADQGDAQMLSARLGVAF